MDTDRSFAGSIPQLYDHAAAVGSIRPVAWQQAAAIEHNAFADVVSRALEPLFPHDPPRFLARTPHGYHDRDRIRDDLRRDGWGAAEIHTIAARSVAASAREPAIAYCQGTPLRNEIEARDAALLAHATALAEAAIARRFGPGPVDGPIQAHVVMAER